MTDIHASGPTDRHTEEQRRNARRAFLRSGPGALARVIASPAVAAQVASSAPAPEAIYATASAATLLAREPLFEVFDEGAELLAVVDLPGASEHSLQVSLDHNRLCLQPSAHGDVYRYGLPAAVDPSTLQWALRNGILEVRLQKQVV